MNDSIYKLVKSHLCIIDKNLQNVKLPIWTDKNWQIRYTNWIFQLDFLAWYVDDFRITTYWLPIVLDEIKDNPNWIPTDYENVFIKTEYRWENVSIDYQLVIPWKSPVAILNWWYFKVRVWNSYEYRRRISVYWKALKLYYMWYIQRLRDYIIKYNWQCCRADLCWDFPCVIPDWIIDLDLTWTNHTTRYFWEKNSPIFFRIYDKTQDLKKEKNCFSWFYPEWYKNECRRIETQLTWRYSRASDPLEWLGIVEIDKSKIQKLEKTDRNVYKTLLYSAVNTIDWINLSIDEKINILKNTKKLLENKIVKFTKSI